MLTQNVFAAVAPLPTATVPRHQYEQVVRSRSMYQRLYDQQTVQLHRRSVEALNKDDRIRELEAENAALHAQLAQRATEPGVQP